MASVYFQGPNFHMQVPSDWFILATPAIQAMFLGPTHENLRANLAISIRQVEPNVAVEQVALAAKTTQQKEYPNYQVVSEGTLTISNQPAYERYYHWVNDNVPISQLQRMVISDQLLFTLTATHHRTHPTEVVDTLEQMVNAFELE